MLYCKPGPVGVITVMVPVWIVQLGWVTLAVGVPGMTGGELTDNVPEDGEVHPAAFCAVSVYKPATKPVKTGED